MPEYSNIQTYQVIENNNPIPIFDRYINFLQNIGINNQGIFYDLRRFEVKFEEDFPFLDFMKEKELTKFSKIPVIPYLSFYSDNSKYYVVCELLIETEEVYNYGSNKYKIQTLRFIENISLEFFKSFKSSPIFFTDEMQDCIEIEKIWKNNINNNFEFDYAIIPFENSEYYNQTNLKFDKKIFKNFVTLTDYNKF